jgi:hypothetical protein
MFVHHSSPEFGFVPFLTEKIYSQMYDDANTENIFLPKFSKLLYFDSFNNPSYSWRLSNKKRTKRLIFLLIKNDIFTVQHTLNRCNFIKHVHYENGIPNKSRLDELSHIQDMLIVTWYHKGPKLWFCDSFLGSPHSPTVSGFENLCLWDPVRFRPVTRSMFSGWQYSKFLDVINPRSPNMGSKVPTKMTTPKTLNAAELYSPPYIEIPSWVLYNSVIHGISGTI